MLMPESLPSKWEQAYNSTIPRMPKGWKKRCARKLTKNLHLRTRAPFKNKKGRGTVGKNENNQWPPNSKALINGVGLAKPKFNMWIVWLAMITCKPWIKLCLKMLTRLYCKTRSFTRRLVARIGLEMTWKFQRGRLGLCLGLRLKPGWSTPVKLVGSAHASLINTAIRPKRKIPNHPKETISNENRNQ